jgi:hypothetical protein
MTLLQRHTTPAADAAPVAARCWVCDPTSDGPMCTAHTRQVREAATAQAQPGYGMPPARVTATTVGVHSYGDPALVDPAALTALLRDKQKQWMAVVAHVTAQAAQATAHSPAPASARPRRTGRPGRPRTPEREPAMTMTTTPVDGRTETSTVDTPTSPHPGVSTVDPTITASRVLALPEPLARVSSWLNPRGGSPAGAALRAGLAGLVLVPVELVTGMATAHAAVVPVAAGITVSIVTPLLAAAGAGVVRWSAIHAHRRRFHGVEDLPITAAEAEEALARWRDRQAQTAAATAAQAVGATVGVPARKAVDRGC